MVFYLLFFHFSYLDRFKKNNKVNPSQQYAINDFGSETGEDTNVPQAFSETSLAFVNKNFRIETFRTKNKLEDGTGTLYMNPPPNVPITDL